MANNSRSARLSQHGNRNRQKWEKVFEIERSLCGFFLVSLPLAVCMRYLAKNAWNAVHPQRASLAAICSATIFSKYCEFFIIVEDVINRDDKIESTVNFPVW